MCSLWDTNEMERVRYCALVSADMPTKVAGSFNTRTVTFQESLKEINFGIVLDPKFSTLYTSYEFSNRRICNEYLQQENSFRKSLLLMLHVPVGIEASQMLGCIFLQEPSIDSRKLDPSKLQKKNPIVFL